MLGLEPTPLGSYSRVFSQLASIVFCEVAENSFPGSCCILDLYATLLVSARNPHSNLIWPFLLIFTLLHPHGLSTAPRKGRHLRCWAPEGGCPTLRNLQNGPLNSYFVHVEWKMTTLSLISFLQYHGTHVPPRIGKWLLVSGAEKIRNEEQSNSFVYSDFLRWLFYHLKISLAIFSTNNNFL